MFVDSSGNVTLAWDNTWAATLPGNPTGWSVTEFCSGAIFNGELILCNGINKPLKVTSNLTISYLTDLATGSNANTPICRFVRTHGRYLCMAGDYEAVDVLYISASDTAGTWLNDPAPNDAVNVTLGSRVPQGSQSIKGLGRFRDKLVIAFEEATLTTELGTYVSADHVPNFDDALEESGCVSHRSLQTIGDSMISCDTVGVTALKRALFTTTTKPERQSELIDPEVQAALNGIKIIYEQEDHIFSVYDDQSYHYMLFIPNYSAHETFTEARGFIHHKNEKLKIDAWSEFTGWRWRAACRSALKRVFFANDNQIYIYGNNADPIAADFVGDQEMFSDNTTYRDDSGNTPVADANDSGVPIDWEWELPWADHGARFNVKDSRYISFDTVGDARFVAEMYVDGIYEDRTYLGESFLGDDTLFTDDLGFAVTQLSPTLSMTFVGGSSPGYGANHFGEAYGDGRPTQDERLYAWTTPYKLYKLRFRGATVGELSFVSVTLGYSRGTIRR